MKRYLNILFVCLIVFGCTPDDEKVRELDPNTIDLHRLDGIESVTPVKVTITTPSGEILKKTDKLYPDTEYKIILKGDEADFLRISYGQIFDILEEPKFQDSKDEFIYRVRTSPDFADRILINVVPLHKSSNTFVREHTQVFTLPY